MRRRAFITLLAGLAAVASMHRSHVAHAQQSRRPRRIAVFTALAADDPESLSRVAAFLQKMQELGWTVGRNLLVEYRFGTGDASRIRKYAAELVALAPDVILATSGLLMGPLLEASRSIPIVFVAATDPVGGGYVASLAHPGGNATGFSVYEYGIASKWLELLKQIAPSVTRVAVIRNPSIAGGAQFGAIQAVAPSLGTQLRPIDPSGAGELERAIAEFAREPNGGLIVIGSALAQFHRDLIVALAARHHLPAVYSSRWFVLSGGLLSYGVETIDQYHLAASYVDRILKGEKPADLPVQAPVKYETVLNMKTAKALGLDVPAAIRLRANEVIE
jgi:putative tryptophan/tyrosine transport system substrate-binding protein